jgi:hypothetical protein
MEQSIHSSKVRISAPRLEDVHMEGEIHFPSTPAFNALMRCTNEIGVFVEINHGVGRAGCPLINLDLV